MTEQWIVIPRWDEFQHRDAGRGQRTVWLRDYARQLDQDEYRDLTFHQRGLLRDLRHSYATTHGQLRDNTLALTRRLGQRVSRRDLEALNHAGYIQLSASKPPALSQHTASLEVEVEKTKTLGDQAASQNGRAYICHQCAGLTFKTQTRLDEHRENVHADYTTDRF